LKSKNEGGRRKDEEQEADGHEQEAGREKQIEISNLKSIITFPASCAFFLLLAFHPSAFRLAFCFFFAAV